MHAGFLQWEKINISIVGAGGVVTVLVSIVVIGVEIGIEVVVRVVLVVLSKLTPLSSGGCSICVRFHFISHLVQCEIHLSQLQPLVFGFLFSSLGGFPQNCFPRLPFCFVLRVVFENFVLG